MYLYTYKYLGIHTHTHSYIHMYIYIYIYIYVLPRLAAMKKTYGAALWYAWYIYMDMEHAYVHIHMRICIRKQLVKQPSLAVKYMKYMHYIHMYIHTWLPFGTPIQLTQRLCLPSHTSHSSYIKPQKFPIGKYTRRACIYIHCIYTSVVYI
jgi:hypothetical protein